MEDEMGGTCSTEGWDEKCIQNFGRETRREERRRWEDNNRMDLREIGWEGEDWINLAQKRPMVGSFEKCNETSVSMKGGVFLD